MSWRLPSMVGLVPIGLPLAGCGPTGTAKTEVKLGEEDNGREIGLGVGQSLVITLASNPATGYRWALVAESDRTVLTVESHEYEMGREARERKLVGAGGEEIWHFRALSRGRTSLNLGYDRPWAEGVAPVKAFPISVIVR